MDLHTQFKRTTRSKDLRTMRMDALIQQPLTMSDADRRRSNAVLKRMGLSTKQDPVSSPQPPPPPVDFTPPSNRGIFVTTPLTLPPPRELSHHRIRETLIPLPAPTEPLPRGKRGIFETSPPPPEPAPLRNRGMHVKPASPIEPDNFMIRGTCVALPPPQEPATLRKRGTCVTSPPPQEPATLRKRGTCVTPPLPQEPAPLKKRGTCVTPAPPPKPTPPRNRGRPVAEPAHQAFAQVSISGTHLPIAHVPDHSLHRVRSTIIPLPYPTETLPPGERGIFEISKPSSPEPGRRRNRGARLTPAPPQEPAPLRNRGTRATPAPSTEPFLPRIRGACVAPPTPRALELISVDGTHLAIAPFSDTLHRNRSPNSSPYPTEPLLPGKRGIFAPAYALKPSPPEPARNRGKHVTFTPSTKKD